MNDALKKISGYFDNENSFNRRAEKKIDQPAMLVSDTSMPRVMAAQEFFKNIDNLTLFFEDLDKVYIPQFLSEPEALFLHQTIERTILSLGNYRELLAGKKIIFKKPEDIFHPQFINDLLILKNFCERYPATMKNSESGHENKTDFVRFAECTNQQIDTGNKLLILILENSEVNLNDEFKAKIGNLIEFLENTGNEEDVRDLNLSDIPNHLFEFILKIQEIDPDYLGLAILGHGVRLEAFPDKKDDGQFLKYNAINIACNNADLDKNFGICDPLSEARLDALLSGTCQVEGIQKQMCSRIYQAVELHTSLSFSELIKQQASHLKKSLPLLITSIKTSDAWGTINFLLKNAPKTGDDLRALTRLLEWRKKEAEEKYRILQIKRTLDLTIKKFIAKFQPREEETSHTRVWVGSEVGDKRPFIDGEITRPAYEPDIYPFGKEKTLLIIKILNRAVQNNIGSRVRDFVQIDSRGEVHQIDNILLKDKSDLELIQKIVDTFSGLKKITILAANVASIEPLTQLKNRDIKKIELELFGKINLKTAIPYPLAQRKGCVVPWYADINLLCQSLKEPPQLKIATMCRLENFKGVIPQTAKIKNGRCYFVEKDGQRVLADDYYGLIRFTFPESKKDRYAYRHRPDDILPERKIEDFFVNESGTVFPFNSTKIYHKSSGHGESGHGEFDEYIIYLSSLSDKKTDKETRVRTAMNPKEAKVQAVMIPAIDIASMFPKSMLIYPSKNGLILYRKYPETLSLVSFLQLFNDRHWGDLYYFNREKQEIIKNAKPMPLPATLQNLSKTPELEIMSMQVSEQAIYLLFRNGTKPKEGFVVYELSQQNPEEYKAFRLPCRPAFNSNGEPEMRIIDNDFYILSEDNSMIIKNGEVQIKSPENYRISDWKIEGDDIFYGLRQTNNEQGNFPECIYKNSTLFWDSAKIKNQFNLNEWKIIDNVLWGCDSEPGKICRHEEIVFDLKKSFGQGGRDQLASWKVVEDKVFVFIEGQEQVTDNKIIDDGIGYSLGYESKLLARNCVFRNNELIFESYENSGFEKYNGIIIKHKNGEALHFFKNPPKLVSSKGILEVIVKS